MWCPYSGEVSTLTPAIPISGTVDQSFLSVQDSFYNNFVQDVEIGAALCVYVNGHCVVDLVGGWTNRSKSVPWSHDTMVNSFSVGKGILSIVLTRLAELTLIDLDSPVGLIWPELSTYGVGSLSLRACAGHRAGLPAISQLIHPAQLYDWDAMCQVLSLQQPWWEPDSTHGYHVNTFGFLMGNLICRAQQQHPRQLLDVIMPEIESAMYFGVPSHAQHLIADLEWDMPPQFATDIATLDSQQQMKILAYRNPENFSGGHDMNTTSWRSAIHPSTNLHSTARAVAQAYKSFDSRQFCSHALQKSVSETVSLGPDTMLDSVTHFGTGFQLPTDKRRFGPNNRAFGHYGAGGAVGFYDPDARLSFGYVMNKMGTGWQNSRNQTLIEAIYQCL